MMSLGISEVGSKSSTSTTWSAKDGSFAVSCSSGVNLMDLLSKDPNIKGLFDRVSGRERPTSHAEETKEA